VWGVCRRVLPCWHDAEDAFQATFLILVRKAGSAGTRGSLGGWLHRVAYRTAVKARAQVASRQHHERRVLEPAASAPKGKSTVDPLAVVTGRELLVVLDEELLHLPDCYRLPMVLCYLEGRTSDDAARQLGWAVRTLKRRLEQARQRLRARLTRRGLTLPAALLTAGLTATTTPARVSSALTAATIKGALLLATGGTAAGVVSTQALGLMKGPLQALIGSKSKATIAALIVACLIGTGVRAIACRALADKPATVAEAGKSISPLAAVRDRTGVPPAAAAEKKPASVPVERQVSLAGRVVDAHDKPVSGAVVAVFAQTVRPYQDKALHTTNPNDSEWRNPLLGRVKTDAEGRFTLTFPHAQLPRWMKPAEIAILGLAPGHAVGWEGVEVKGDSLEAVLRLGAEEPVRGRLVDLQGLPAVGVKVHLLKAAGTKDGKFTGLQFNQPLADTPSWPAPATTDDKGRFVLRGVNRKMALRMRIQDDRFATDELTLEPGGKEEVTRAVTPARIFEGRVIAEDTNQPMPGIGVNVVARLSREPHFAFLSARTDKEGRFRVNHFAADGYYATTEDVEGQPYFAINHIEISWPDKLKTKQTLEIALPRGVLQSGKVVDAVTGKPLADAQLMYLPKLFNNPLLKPRAGIDLWTYQVGRARTKADGTFQIPVLPGSGHIEVHAPWGTEYVTYTRTRKEIFGDEREGGNWPAHGFIKLDIKPDAKPDEAIAKLQPAVTIQGQLLGPDGKPVAKARLAVRTLTADPHRETGITEEHNDTGLHLGPTIHVKDGQFKVPGCDPAMRYRAYILDADNHRAATFELEGQDTTPKPLTVQWQPCASASARFVADTGRPAGTYPLLLSVKESLTSEESKKSVMRRPAPFLDVIVTDKEGKGILENLIPGVRYLLRQPDGKEVKEFTAEPGKKVELGDIVVDPKK
jgi:RNA polymerase sigma factor (sigma-70 family)